MNYTCYPAISKEYLVERDDAWRPTGQALAVMEELLKEVGDKQLLRLVRLYAMFPVKILTRYIAMQLHRSKHKKVAQVLLQQVRQAAKPIRNENSPEKKKNSFGSRENEHRTMRKSGKQKDTGQIFFEEPFVASRDSIEGKYYVMIWKKGFRTRRRRLKKSCKTEHKK